MNKPSSNPVKPTDHDAVDSMVPSDPGILAFGTSVSINNDLRRSIGVEIQEIEAHCTKMKDDVNVESSIREELNKTTSHAIKEVKSLEQGASDLVENINMNRQIAFGLESTLVSALAWNTRKISDVQSDASFPVDETIGSNTSLSSLQDGLKSREAEMNNLSSSFYSDLKQLNGLLQGAKDSRTAREALDLTNEELEAVLAASDVAIENALKELELEKTKSDHIDETIADVESKIEDLKVSIQLKVNLFRRRCDDQHVRFDMTFFCFCARLKQLTLLRWTTKRRLVI
jgi:chromosome segregation ATPase